MASPKLDPLVLTDEERQVLEGWARRRKTAQALALRSRVVLACADGAAVSAVATDLGISRATAGKWRSRFLESRLEGLSDEPRPGLASHGHRRARREGDHHDAGTGAAERRHALVDPVDGQVSGHVPVGGVPHLAGLRDVVRRARMRRLIPTPATRAALHWAAGWRDSTVGPALLGHPVLVPSEMVSSPVSHQLVPDPPTLVGDREPLCDGSLYASCAKSSGAFINW